MKHDMFDYMKIIVDSVNKSEIDYFITDLLFP